ncbi:penicillin-binding protein [Streptococcus suis]|nr:penicillin-binding protein [Streptococcus suis]
MTTKHSKFKRMLTSFSLTNGLGIMLRSIKLLVDYLAVIFLVLGSLGAGVGVGYVFSLFDQVEAPSKEELLSNIANISRNSHIVFSDGSPVADINSDLLRSPIENADISDYIKQAVIATEDVTFESHNGVVPKAVLRAALGLVGFGSSSGGSTITQQLIKQQIVGDAPTFTRKANEIITALALERDMSKEDILTTYLNVSPFGRNNQGKNIAGVEEAARGIFGKSTKELTVPQAAFIAGLPQSPIVYSPYAADGSLKSDEYMSYGLARHQDVLYNMYRAEFLTKEEYETYKDYDIRQDFLPPSPVTEDTKDFLYYAVLDEAIDVMYDYLVERDKVSDAKLKNDETVQEYRELAAQEISQGGYTVTSTVNPAIHNAMNAVARDNGYLLDEGNGVVETGSVLLDNKTGAVLGFVGGRDFSQNKNNHAFDTVRSPASTIKPILAYGIAMDQGLIGSASIFSDYPARFSSGEQIMNVNNRGSGMIDLQTALNRSVNIPVFWTYKLLQQSGVDVKSYMEKMDYHIPMYDIESLPLGGGIDVSVATNTNAYQTLANGGVYNKHYLVENIKKADGTVVYQHQAAPVQVYSKATSSIMMNLLKGVISSGLTTTYANRIRAINPQVLANTDIAGKTGTSNYAGDAWLMLSTPQVTLGSWAGYDDNTSLDVFASHNSNSHYVAYLSNAIYQVAPELFSGRFTLDDSVIASNVVTSTGQRPGSVQVNGRTINVSGATTTSYWAKNGAPVTNYRFMLGGTEADYQTAWNSLFGNQQRRTTSSSSNSRTGSSSSSSSSSSANNNDGDSEPSSDSGEEDNP